MADDIAVRLARNETRWLSLMSAFPVNSGTARRLANGQPKVRYTTAADAVSGTFWGALVLGSPYWPELCDTASGGLCRPIGLWIVIACCELWSLRFERLVPVTCR